MSTEQLGYKAYKWPKCGWVHAAIPRAVLQQIEGYEQHNKCARCGAPSDIFVPAVSGDAPLGSTIQGVYVPGAWDDFFTACPTVSDDFGDGFK